MLLELFGWLADNYSRTFSVFEYITLRAVLACATALLIGLVAGPRVIRKLTELKIGQAVRSYGPQTHLVKTGTPTMGGALILISIGVSTLLWADWTNRFVWVVLLVTFGFGWIGWLDDYRKVVYRDPEGMPARQKFFWQALIGLVASTYLAFAISAPANVSLWEFFQGWLSGGLTTPLPSRADLIVPFFKSVSYPLGVFGFIALSWFVIVGTSNAVNLTDGLDGLAIGAMAVCVKHEIVLAIVGGLFLFEALSVIIQVLYFKATGKRFFKMAPVHHHFEKLGWSEPTVVIRFWIIAFLLALVGLATLRLR